MVPDRCGGVEVDGFVFQKAIRHRKSRGLNTHRPLSNPFLGLPYRILNINHKEELLRGLWIIGNSIPLS